MDSMDLFPFSKDSLEESDILLGQTLKRWADREVISKRLEYGEDYEELLKPAIQKLFIDVELQKMIWPEQCGGSGFNIPETARTLALALEQVGRADTGIGYLCSITFALCSSFNFGCDLNEELCLRMAPLFCEADTPVIGSLVLTDFAHEEPAATIPFFRGRRLPAKARREGDSWVVSGEKMRPLNSGFDAGLFGVLCALENEEEPALILIPGASPGLERGEPFFKTGLAASINADITLNRVSVPAGNLVFRGEDPLRRMLSRLYLNLAAVSVGGLFTVFEIIKEWGETRVIKGKGNLLKENPLAASLMAEIAHEIMVNRMLLHQLVGIFSSPDIYRQSEKEQPFIAALSVASHVSISAEKAINQSMELMGSAGYATEWNLERYWRDIKTMQVHLGSWELNKMELARYFFRSQNL